MHLQRSSFILLFLLSMGVSHAQQKPATKKQDEKTQVEKPKTDEKKETFGDYVQKVGEGIWGRVKERLNLDETLANLEEKKNKFLGDKEEKNEKNEEKKGDQPKDTKTEPDAIRKKAEDN